MDYKELYELVKMENEKLVEKNIELAKELDKYKMMYIRKSSYAENMQLIIEEVEKQKQKNKRKSKINIDNAI